MPVYCRICGCVRNPRCTFNLCSNCCYHHRDQPKCKVTVHNYERDGLKYNKNEIKFPVNALDRLPTSVRLQSAQGTKLSVFTTAVEKLSFLVIPRGECGTFGWEYTITYDYAEKQWTLNRYGSASVKQITLHEAKALLHEHVHDLSVGEHKDLVTPGKRFWALDLDVGDQDVAGNIYTFYPSFTEELWLVNDRAFTSYSFY